MILTGAEGEGGGGGGADEKRKDHAETDEER